MMTAKGKSILKGIAIGKIRFLAKKQAEIKENAADSAAELKRFQDAKALATEQLQALYDKAAVEAGEEHAAIFEIHMMMLDDDDYNEAITDLIQSEGKTAEFAVKTTGEQFAETFASMDDEYMKARAADVRDISGRVVNILTGTDTGPAESDEPFIIVAEDLAPSETVQLDKSKLLGFVTRLGSTNSHTAILARNMNIPALIGTEISEDWNGRMAIIDGYNSCIYIDPTEELLKTLDEKRVRDLEQRAMLQQLKGQPNVTLDGREINLYANIGNVSDVGMVLENDAGGIGLFRSEFIYLHSATFPTEDEQFAIYKKVAEMMGGKKVIIRTLDIGADKQADYFNLPKEENPALGYRAIRICLMQHDIFKTQLRAILRAAAFGKVSIMFPMIISVSEVRQAKEILEACRKELIAEGKEVGEVEIGIMIETPAAVMVADELAEEVEFFSIGTNDLTQYTLAIDRQNPKLDPFYDSHHPAVLRLIEMTVQAGHRHNCWVGICGELGADPTLTETFLRMGLDELSVNPGGILGLRKIIRELNLGAASTPEATPAVTSSAKEDNQPKKKFSLFGKGKK
ncbi:MAG: phosphoenolpyruvate--protein phosphotransferase [Clostridia bacterium]|nr:phosphoenolpyruvate--protein phosphotransferase [Clostridia bacterium]